MLNYRKDKEKMRSYIEENAEYFEHLNKETLAALGLLLNVKDKFNEILKCERKEYNMCKALDDIYKDGVNEGISQGISQGLSLKVIDLIVKKVQKNKSVKEIADELETDVESIQEIYKIVLKHAPDYNIDAIYKELGK